ncbi:MAG: LruC domain-containing protein [Proteobacteria bacterium]|nr:LruC domain-containing protein [Pseudomonadota bacterium]
MVRIDDVFPSTRAALPPVNGAFTNTVAAMPERPPASVRFRITFATPVAPDTLALAPFDPYLLVPHSDGVYDIHMPGHDGFADRPVKLPVESGPTAFLDASGTPWAMLVPTDWRYSLERTAVSSSYSGFDPWRQSRGTKNTDWYTLPNTGKVTNPLGTSARSRAWTLSSTAR